jgi:DNA-binding CsgD family transcriptional regulator
MQAFQNDMAEGTVCWGMCDALFTPQALGPVYDIALSLSAETREMAIKTANSGELFPAILAELARPVTRILLIEDLHWADYATLDFIKFIARRISILSTLLVLSYRPDEIDATHPAQSVLGDLPAKLTARIELSPLSFAGVEQLNTSTSLKNEQLYEVTGGNPFFVTELLASTTPGDVTVPASIKEAVNARLNRLTSEERSFLEFASLVPGAIDPGLLRQKIPDAEMLAMAAVGRNLLKREHDGSLRFRHELARLATLARIPAGQRRDYHADFLSILLERDDVSLTAQIVHHASGAGNAQSVLQYAPLAADQAAAIGSHREAAAHLATALEFIDQAEPQEAASLYEKWAYEAGLALTIDDEVIEARRHAMTLWRALGRMDKVGENMRWLSRLLWYRGESAQANRYADEAVRILENEAPSKEKAMAFSLRSQMHMLHGRMEDAVRWGEKALATSDSPDVKIHALNNIGTARIFRGNTDGLKDMSTSLNLARQHGYHEDAARVYTNLAEYGVEFKDFELAEKVINEGIAFDTQHDLDAWTFYLVGRQAQLRLEQGRLHDAVTIAEGVLSRNDQTLLMRLPAEVVLAKAKMRLGEKNANTLLQSALENALSVDELQYIAPIRSALIELAWYENNPAAATEHIEAASALPDQASPWLMAEFYFWASRCGFAIPERLLASFPEPYRLRLLGEHRQAAEIFQTLGAPYLAAACLCENTDADSIFLASGLAKKMRAARLIEKLRDVANKASIEVAGLKASRGPYGAARQHPLGLTKKEQQVLELLVNGASNQEIAEQLSRSKRTVEHHVSSIFSKMNVENRVDVLLRVQNEPWLLGKSQ